MYTKLEKTVAIHHKYAKGCREAQQGPARLCPSWEKALSPSHFTLQINFPNFNGQKPKQTMSEGKRSRNPFLGLCLLYVRVIETGWEEPLLAKESCQPRWQTLANITTLAVLWPGPSWSILIWRRVQTVWFWVLRSTFVPFCWTGWLLAAIGTLC